MGRTCTVCTHKDLDEINRLLLCSDSYRDLARQFNLSKDALARHKESHIPEALTKAEDIKEVAQADKLLDELLKVREKTYSLLDKAEQAKEVKSWPGFLRELREQIKLMAELEGRLASQPQINILVAPQWVELRTVIIRALEPYPEAREAVVHAIRE